MNITIPKNVFSHMEQEDLALFGRDRLTLRHLDDFVVSLLPMERDQIDGLRNSLKVLETKGNRQATVIIQDIDRWTDILDGEDIRGKRPRSVQQFTDMLIEFIRRVPGHRVYRKANESNLWLAHYVNNITYTPPKRDRDWYTPPSCDIWLLHYDLGQMTSSHVSFVPDDIDRRNMLESIIHKNVYVETSGLREAYLYNRNTYDNIVDQIGKQFTVEGFGSPVGENTRGSRRVFLMKDGIPSKVVIDVFSEDGTHRDTNRNNVNERFWKDREPSRKPKDTEDVLHANIAYEDFGETLEFSEEDGPIEIPIHPYLVVYDLAKHQRLKVHVDDMVEYKYDTGLGQNLVLPETTKNLVATLVEQGRISFADIISGKGSGACVVLGGRPGVGKTLTAEVFAESTERPLLTVQAAQLGKSPTDIEKTLALYMNRASRFNAVMLLDEADVYIGERGSNLNQNAIVASFLRVLENHNATIFMTTNRLDTVDDAIISRCIARIDYDSPSVKDQKEIWKVLNRINDAKLTDDEIDEIVAIHNDLTGRDIKQMLKLGELWATGHDSRISPEIIGFVKQFLPTRRFTSQ